MLKMNVMIIDIINNLDIFSIFIRDE
jgi:hypothetical protein